MLNNSIMSLTSNPFPFNVENDRKCFKVLLKRTHKKQLLCALLGKNSLISAFSPSFTLGDSVHLVADLVDRMNRERSNVCSSVIWPIMSSPPHKTSAFQPKTIQWIVEYPHAPVYVQSNWETPSPSKSDPAEIKRSYPHYNMIWTITSFTKQKFKSNKPFFLHVIGDQILFPFKVFPESSVFENPRQSWKQWYHLTLRSFMPLQHHWSLLVFVDHRSDHSLDFPSLFSSVYVPHIWKFWHRNGIAKKNNVWESSPKCTQMIKDWHFTHSKSLIFARTSKIGKYRYGWNRKEKK